MYKVSDFATYELEKDSSEKLLMYLGKWNYKYKCEGCPWLYFE